MSDKLEANPDAYMGNPGLLGDGGYHNRLRWDGEHRPEASNCTDCRYMVGYVSWWCTNRERADAVGTGTPGDEDCKWWTPCVRDKPPWHVRLGRLLRG